MAADRDLAAYCVGTIHGGSNRGDIVIFLEEHQGKILFGWRGGRLPGRDEISSDLEDLRPSGEQCGEDVYQLCQRCSGQYLSELCLLS